MVSNPAYPPVIAQPPSPGYVLGNNRLPNATRPTFVLATISATSTGVLQLVSVLMDSGAVPATSIATYNIQETGAVTISNANVIGFFVPAGFSYKLSILSGAPVLSSLVEYTL